MFLIVLVGMSLVMSSMAELASMFPDSGAQYVWVSVLAPRSIQKYLSFVVGRDYACLISSILLTISAKVGLHAWGGSRVWHWPATVARSSSSP